MWDERPGPLSTPCHIWKGRPNAQGYGTITRDGRTQPAHRWRWEQERGPLDPDEPLDHLCRVHLCVNLDHLEPVSWHVNSVGRSEGATGVNARKTHCKHGHPLSGGNLRIRPNGGRVCRECERKAARDKMRRKYAEPEQREAFNRYRRELRAKKGH